MNLALAILVAVALWYIYNKFNNEAFTYVDGKLFKKG